MPTTAELLEARADWRVRPTQYAQLLIEPVVNGPVGDAITTAYDDWEADHGTGRRFYIAGMAAFLKATGLDAARLFGYRDRAHEKVLKETAWSEMTSAEKAWNKELGKPQISLACQREPMSFAKAAQVIMACEIALADILKNTPKGLKVPVGIDDAQQLYSRLGIRPAVWYVNDFTDNYMEAVRQKYGDPIGAITEGAGLESSYVVNDMLKGHTVTRDTATKIQTFLSTHYEVSIGRVKAKPTNTQGYGRASQNEGLELC